MVLGDVLIVHDMEGIAAVDSFSSTIRAGSNALVEAAHFIGV